MNTRLLVALVLVLESGLATAASSNEIAAVTIESALESRNPDVRKDAVKVLGLLDSIPSYRERLEFMLKDKDLQVRLAAVSSLAEAKDKPALEEALDDKTPEVRFAAAKALFKLHDAAGKQALLRVLEGRAKTSSSFIVDQARDARRLLETPEPLLILAAHEGISFIPVPYLGTAVFLAEKMISRSGTPSRATTALLLGKAIDPEVIAALENALTDKKASVRGAAIQAIALSDNPALTTDAELLLNDKSRPVRVRAAVCYLRLASIATNDPVLSVGD